MGEGSCQTGGPGLAEIYFLYRFAKSMKTDIGTLFLNARFFIAV